MENALKKKYDLQSWNSLLDSVLASGDVEKIRKVFAAVTSVLPSQDNYYLRWLEFERERGDTQAMEEIFKDVLPLSYSVALWNFYLGYILQAQSQAPEVIQSAYEFALSQIGNDIESGSIWLDYIAFVKEGFVNISLLMHRLLRLSRNSKKWSLLEDYIREQSKFLYQILKLFGKIMMLLKII